MGIETGNEVSLRISFCASHFESSDLNLTGTTAGSFHSYDQREQYELPYITIKYHLAVFCSQTDRKQQLSNYFCAENVNFG